MAVSHREIEIEEADRTGKGLSRRGPIFLLQTTAILLFLIAFEIGGVEKMAVLRVLAGSPRPWAERVDFNWGDWGFTMWHPVSMAVMRILILGATAALMALAARGLKHKKRWAYYMGLAVAAIFLTLNTIKIGADLWYVYTLLRNETGTAFGKPEPQWADIPLALPALLLLLEILMLIALRLMSKLRVDVLH